MITSEELRKLSLFDGLNDEQLSQLVAAGVEVQLVPGAELWQMGEHADHWCVLIDGAIALHRDGKTVARMDVPGQWAGGLRAWDREGVYLASARAAEAGRVFRLPSAALRELSTEWFPFIGHILAGLYGTARAVESAALRRDALVTLGTLAAGLAHELNNPAAAATRAVDSLRESCETLLSSLRHVADGAISAQQFIELDSLRREVKPRSAIPDPLALAEDEENLAEWLSRRGVTREWDMAPTLAAAGIDEAWCERASGVLGEAALEPGLEWVASTLSLFSLLAEVEESTRRVSDIVASVKSYTQMDRAGAQRFDVTDGLESTIVMLGNKLRGVEIVRSYGSDVPEIEGHPGELNQVWTNLIDNAVDAMDGTGTIRLTTRVEGNDLVVEVCDSGRGMPPEVVARAFEAFFTTKDVGKGTGLGLDIARRIVDRHGGVIGIESEPGQTIIRVRIPVHSSEPAG
ncbi:MAG: ATP-binding protein [Acidimicrobiales bacterium]